jgi:hypothetical protein
MALPGFGMRWLCFMSAVSLPVCLQHSGENSPVTGTLESIVMLNLRSDRVIWSKRWTVQHLSPELGSTLSTLVLKDSLSSHPVPDPALHTAPLPLSTGARGRLPISSPLLCSDKLHLPGAPIIPDYVYLKARTFHSIALKEFLHGDPM